MNKQTIIFEDTHWSYIPKAIPSPDLVFKLLFEQIKDKVSIHQISSAFAEGKTFPSKRLSCVFSDQASSQYGNDIPIFSWNDSSMIVMLRERVEQLLNVKFDYVLCHLYRDGNDHISPHRDKEAMKTIIGSVSLGAPRKFRLRKMNKKNGWCEEFEMESGAMIAMKPSCQHNYLHWVPQQKRITEPRINLTFRQNE
jgi:alkylated DNA repair dioxygenase AlkB